MRVVVDPPRDLVHAFRRDRPGPLRQLQVKNWALGDLSLPAGSGFRLMPSWGNADDDERGPPDLTRESPVPQADRTGDRVQEPTPMPSERRAIVAAAGGPAGRGDCPARQIPDARPPRRADNSQLQGEKPPPSWRVVSSLPPSSGRPGYVWTVSEPSGQIPRPVLSVSSG